MKVEPDAMSLGDFCERHAISRSGFYKLEKAGIAPRIMRVGGKLLISREAAARWRREREQAPRREGGRGGDRRSKAVTADVAA
jgi:predicted DNA-binding transcriptional regulator AlpA